jgi:hypothetical protein
VVWCVFYKTYRGDVYKTPPRWWCFKINCKEHHFGMVLLMGRGVT